MTANSTVPALSIATTANLDSTPLVVPKVEPLDTVKVIAVGTDLVNVAPDVSVEDLKSIVQGFRVTVRALAATDAEMLFNSENGILDDPSNTYDQLAAVVPDVKIHTTLTVAFAGTLTISFSPLD